MTKIKNFNDWLIAESVKLKGTSLEVVSEIEAVKRLAEAMMEKEDLTDEEVMYFYVLKESNITLNELFELNEGLGDKLISFGKEVLNKTKETASAIKDFAGKELSGVPEFFKALAGGIKNLVTHVIDFFKKALTIMLGTPIDWAKKALGSGFAKIESETEKIAKASASKLEEEAKHFSDIVKGLPKLLSPKSVGENMEKALAKGGDVETSDLAIVEESVKVSLITALTEAVKTHSLKEIKEGLMSIEDAFVAYSLSESDDHGHGHTKIPFVSTISSVLEKLPPFSWLSKLANFFGDKANEYLTQLSSIMKERGAIKETIKFAVMGTLVGLGLEYLVKSGSKSVIGWLVPPIHEALVVVGTVATGICIIHVASSVIDGLKDLDKENQDSAHAMAH